MRQHFLGQAGVGAEEDRLVHDFIRTGHLADDAQRLRAVFLQLHEDGIAEASGWIGM